jgi:hypothetical protein
MIVIVTCPCLTGEKHGRIGWEKLNISTGLIWKREPVDGVSSRRARAHGSSLGEVSRWEYFLVGH